MRVLIITGMYPKPMDDTSGDFFHRQVVELSRLGLEARVICPIARIKKAPPFLSGSPKAIHTTQTFSIDNIRVTYSPYWNFPLGVSPKIEIALRYFALLRTIESDLTLADFDLLHTYNLFPGGYVGMLLARRMGIPCISTAVGSDIHTHPYRSRVIARLTREMISRSDQIIAVSRELAGRIEQLAQPSAPVKVVYNGVDTDTFKHSGEKHVLRRKLGLPAGGIGLCTASRLLETKGLRELVKAFDIVHSRHPSTWLVVLGDGPLKHELEDWVKKQQLEGKVFITGSRPHQEIASWMCAADIFVLASYAEGLPNVVLEAMACGRPVIATHVGGIPEVAIDKETALLVPPRQSPPLVDAINSLILDPELRERMGKAGYERIRTDFSWSQSAKQLADVYFETIRRSNSLPQEQI